MTTNHLNSSWRFTQNLAGKSPSEQVKKITSMHLKRGVPLPHNSSIPEVFF